MNTINWSAMIRLGADKLKSLMPLEVLYDGKPVFVICNVEDVIIIADHHIRVKNMLRAMDKRARAGMPKPTKITTEMMI